MKHTPTPWEKLKDYSITSPDAELGSQVLYMPSNEAFKKGGFKREADLNRAIACVNACEGINPEAISGLIETLERIQDNASGGFTDIRNGVDEGSEAYFVTIWRQVQAALAKAKA